MVEMQSSYNRVEFDFNSGRASPSGSSPSTPKGFGDYYCSAPTSPAHAKLIYLSVPTSPARAPRFHREIEHFSYGEEYKLEAVRSPLLSLQSPNSGKPQHKRNIWSIFSPKRKKQFNHYETDALADNKETIRNQGRTRERDSSESGRRATRSLSPFRVSEYYPWEEDEQQKSGSNTKEVTSTNASTFSMSSSSSKGNKKWRLKDLLLFRSASEGRAFDKDPLKKYSYFHRKLEVAKTTGSASSTQGSSSSSIIPVRRGQISAHELHYTVNKAISQDMKKKSFLPYKQGILGRLAFSPTVHTLAHGFGSLAHTRG